MNFWTQLARDFGRNMTIATLSLFKLCCISLGVLLGMCVPKNWKQYAIPVFSLLFLVTYIPLMIDLYRTYQNSKKRKESSENKKSKLIGNPTQLE